MAGFDKYAEVLAWALGAKAAQIGDISMRARISPALRGEFDSGQSFYREGYLHLRDDFDPHVFSERLRRDNALRYQDRLKSSAA